MSIVYFDQDKKFMCPCGCKKKFVLSIQQTEGYGWNAYVTYRKKFIASVGETYFGGDQDE